MLTAPDRRRASSTSGRTWSGRRAHPGPGAAGHHGHAAARRGARARRVCGVRPLRAARSTDSYTLAGRAARTMGADASPSTASATPRSTAGPATSTPARRRSRLGSCTPTSSAPAGSSRSDAAARTACTRTSCGACAATSSTSPPTARSATSGWAGPATSRCSRPPRRFLYDCAGVPRRAGCATSPLEQARRDGTVPLVVPVDPRRSTTWPPSTGARGATPPTLVPWVLYERFGDVGCCARAVRACAGAGSTASTALAGRRRGCGTSGFQLGDWLDPAAPPGRPGEARTDGDLVATAYLARVARAVVAAPAELLGRGDDAARLRRRSPTQVARRVRRRVRDADGTHDQRRADRATRWRSRSTCSPSPRSGEARGGPPGRAGARRRLPHRAPASSAPRSSRTRSARGGHLDRRLRDLLLQTEMPVVAVPGDDGRDHGLGALGHACCPTARSTPAR